MARAKARLVRKPAPQRATKYVNAQAIQAVGVFLTRAHVAMKSTSN